MIIALIEQEEEGGDYLICGEGGVGLHKSFCLLDSVYVFRNTSPLLLPFVFFGSCLRIIIALLIEGNWSKKTNQR